MTQDTSNVDDQAPWTEIAAVADFEPGSAKEFVLGPHIVAVFFVDGQFFAIDGLCAHQGGPIAKGSLSRDGSRPCVTCPWHGWQYDLESGIQLVNRQPLQQTFPIRQRDGRVEIQLPA